MANSNSTSSYSSLEFFIFSPSQLDYLTSLKNTLASYTSLFIYTDGSLTNANSPQSRMGLGWLITDQDHTVLGTFNSSIKHWSSPTKAESMAIATALSVCPSHGNITIYTDSQNCINTYNYFCHSSAFSMRRSLKTNNYLIWHSIKLLITSLNLTVKLIKIKAHSGIPLHDHADYLAKTGARSPYVTTINSAHKDLPNATLTWNSELIIDRNIRQTIKTIHRNINFNALIEHNNLLYCKNAINNNQIDLHWSQIWLRHNSSDSPTSQPQVG